VQLVTVAFHGYQRGRLLERVSDKQKIDAMRPALNLRCTCTSMDLVSAPGLNQRFEVGRGQLLQVVGVNVSADELANGSGKSPFNWALKWRHCLAPDDVALLLRTHL